MSRAELRAASTPHRLLPHVREAIGDFADHAWSFLGANLLLGALWLAISGLSIGRPAVLLLLPLLVLPAAGIMRMATRQVRESRTGLRAFAEIFRRGWRVLGLGTAQIAVTVVLLADLLIAMAIGSWAGTMLAVAAAYGLLGLWVLALLAWPLLLDPERDGEPIRRRLWLALLIVALHPIRVGLYALTMGVLTLISIVFIAPLVTAAVSLLWLVDARYVLSIADRLEGRLPAPVEDDPGFA